MFARRTVQVVPLSLLALVLVPSQAFAAGVEKPESWLGLPLWFWQWGNIFVFWGLLGYLLLPIIRKFLAGRKEEIKSDAATAAEQRAEAESMRRGLDDEIAKLRSDMDDFLARNEAEGERERKEIRARAEVDKERIIEEARGEIAHRFERARAELLEETSRRAAALAEEKLQAELQSADGSELFEKSLGQLRGSAS